MKKSAPLIVLALLALIATLVMLNSRQDEPMGDQTAEPGPAASRELSGRQATSASSSRDNTRAPQDGTTRSTDPSKPSGSAPLPQDLHSSLVTAELKEGETLVMGGYRKPNGSHEFILVTPRNVDIKGYEGMIQLQARIFSLEPEHLEQSGLAGLATDKRNADGKSEVWKLEERKDSLQNAGQIINFQQPVNEETITRFRGYSACRGMRRINQPHIFQSCHNIANCGRANVETGLFSKILRAYRLCITSIRIDQQAE